MPTPIFVRLNEKVPRPNKSINFIHALPSPAPIPNQAPAGGDGPAGIAALSPADALLHQVAAFSSPIMARHSIRVNRLAEHVPNADFLGRNFNAGALIELVLRRRSGAFFSFRQVCLVMAHELAHCRHMDHGPAFWAFCRQLEAEMRDLWATGYVGDGAWSRGFVLNSGARTAPRTGVDTDRDDFPTSLCGGSFRSAKRRPPPRRRATGKAPKQRAKAQPSRAVSASASSSSPSTSASTPRSRSTRGASRSRGKQQRSSSARSSSARIAYPLLPVDAGPSRRPGLVPPGQRERELRLAAIRGHLRGRTMAKAPPPAPPTGPPAPPAGAVVPAGDPTVVVLEDDDDDDDSAGSSGEDGGAGPARTRLASASSRGLSTAAQTRSNSPCPSLMTDFSTDNEEAAAPAGEVIVLEDSDGDGDGDGDADEDNADEGNDGTSGPINLELDPLYSAVSDRGEGAAATAGASNSRRPSTFSADDLRLRSEDSFTFRGLSGRVSGAQVLEEDEDEVERFFIKVSETTDVDGEAGRASDGTGGQSGADTAVDEGQPGGWIDYFQSLDDTGDFVF